MGLWEFLRQWRPSRITLGILASILLHLGVVALVLWGGMLVPRSKRDVKKGDALIVELPKPEEPAAAGPRSAPPPPSRPSPPSPAAPSPKPPAVTAPTPKPAPAPDERRVASAARPPAPTPPAPPAPKAAEPAPSLLKGTEPVPAPAAPAPKTAESTAQAAPSEPAAPVRPPADHQQVASLPQGGPPPGPPVPDMRTALRRGAGGTGLQGRGGIEGEPIRLDSEDPRYNDYLEQIRRRIQEKWGYPCIKTERSCEFKEATLDIEFGILKDGRVQFVEVVHNSEYQIYDEYAATAIKLASPFPPVPQAMMNTVKPGSPGVPIRARFAYYIVKSSLTNLLR